MIANLASEFSACTMMPEEAASKYGLKCNKALVPFNTLENIKAVIEHDPIFTTGLWYDGFLERLMTGSPAREWVDADDMGACLFLATHCGLTKINPRQVRDVLDWHHRQSPRHAVREWLGRCEWDQKARIDAAFETYWGVIPNAELPHAYVQAASRNFFIGLIARVNQPGCQLDNMVVFEGEQGIRKSSSLRALAGDWYAQMSESVQSKDFFQALQGKWLIEVGELDAFSRAEVTRVKTVISTPVDRYRQSYGRTSSDHPRQCVFAGTTNKDDWGNDDTGLRRFWPIRCGTIDVKALERDREKLFAEALIEFKHTRNWWHMPEDATKAVQKDRQADHAWSELIVPRLMEYSEITTADVLEKILKHDPYQMNRSAELSVASVLYRAGWRKKNVRRDGRQTKVWISPTWTETQEF